VCTSFYFIEGISTTRPIVDATAKEEKLAKSRLSICMNIFEDLCGMSTLGSLEVDPRLLLDCTKTALYLSKEMTKKVRECFSQRFNTHSLLDFSLFEQSSSKIELANRQQAASFLDSLFTAQPNSVG